MLKNYLLISLRNFIKEKSFTTINLVGLAVGITSFLILSLFIIDELNYDSFNEHADRIYRVYVEMYISGEESITSKTAAPTGPVILDNFAEVESYTRLGQFIDPIFTYGDKSFKEWEIFAVDSSFFDIFSMHFIEGNESTALAKPNSIVLTKEMAVKYFGEEKALGKTLVTDENESYLVTGVVENFPHNSHFACDFITSIYHHKEHTKQDWHNLLYSTYIKLKKGTDPELFQAKLKTIVDNYIGPHTEKLLGMSMEQFYSSGNRYDLKIQPMTSIYLYSTRDYGIDLNTEWGEVKSSDIMYVIIFSIVAVFILLIAVINFMNLSTARSEKRSTEVGIRKTLGSDKTQLITQFITESIVVTFVAFILSLVLLEIFLPFFNYFSGKQITLSFFENIYTIPLMLAGVIIVGLLAGSYPAFFLSSFKTVQVIKPDGGKNNRKSKLRSFLVILQFAISIALLISTLLIQNQLEYIQTKNLGFNKNLLMTIYNADYLKKQQLAFKTELLNRSDVLSASYSGEMFRSGIPGRGYYFDRTQKTSPFLCQYIDADYDFLNTYEIELKQGRFFNRGFSTDTASVIINEAIVQNHAISDPVGKVITQIIDGKKHRRFRIIGVISNFNYESLHKNIRPLVLHLKPPIQNSIFAVRLNSRDLDETISSIKSKWIELTGKDNFHYRFVDENLNRLYENERRTGIVASVFTFIAIFIACLGLFALAAFVTEQKTKEIGIRKVLGAGIPEIVILLSKQFTKWVIIANIIAWPVTYYFMNNWLQDFAYRIEIGWSVFVIAGVMTLMIALLTISYQTVKAATANPVKSLKYE